MSYDYLDEKDTDKNYDGLKYIPHSNLRNLIKELKEELKRERECSDKLYRYTDHGRLCVNYDELPSRGFACDCGHDSVMTFYDQTQQQRTEITKLKNQEALQVLDELSEYLYNNREYIDSCETEIKTIREALES